MMRSVSENVAKAFGFTVDYYFTEKTEKVLEYDLTDIVDKCRMKFLIPDTESLKNQNLNVEVLKTEFPNGKTPTVGDMVFFDQLKIYHRVVSSFDKDEHYLIGLDKYKQLSVTHPEVNE